jgi:hypothetical protein
MLSRPQGHSATGRIISMKKSSDTLGNRTRDLPVCSAVPKLTAPPRPRQLYEEGCILSRFTCFVLHQCFPTRGRGSPVGTVGLQQRCPIVVSQQHLLHQPVFGFFAYKPLLLPWRTKCRFVYKDNWLCSIVFWLHFFNNSCSLELQYLLWRVKRFFTHKFIKGFLILNISGTSALHP